MLKLDNAVIKLTFGYFQFITFSFKGTNNIFTISESALAFAGHFAGPVGIQYCSYSEIVLAFAEHLD